MKTKLSESEKRLLEEHAGRITHEDEVRVKQETTKELQKLRKMQEKSKLHKAKLQKLVENAQLLYDILTDDTFRPFPPTRKWMVFALNYLISPIDLIPDSIGEFGYYDDALVLQWVIYMLEDEIQRYKAYLEAKDASKNGNRLITLQKKPSNSYLIIVPGILSKPTDEAFRKRWLDSVIHVFPESSICMLNWNTLTCLEMTKVIHEVNHMLTLKVQMDSVRFLYDWEDAKQHAEYFCQALLIDIEKLKHQNSDIKIDILGHSLGCRLVCQLLEKVQKNMVNRVFLLGGADKNRRKITDNLNKIDTLYNFHSFDDKVLKFVFENFEQNHQPIGIYPVSERSIPKLFDINCTEIIHMHSDYIENAGKLISQHV